jgi:alkanesulfonate monooxygenase SsuD/methylene tetrahydromethanopterin reductase-like flavin-dependent oxidoreductase (luciferase family)
VLRRLLTTGEVDFDGMFYHAHGRQPAPLAQPPAIIASALRENASRLRGESADGAITWICSLAYIERVGLPAMRAGAEQTGRTPPPIVAHVPIVLTTDADAARAVARRQPAVIRACPTTAVCSSMPATRRQSAANGRAR